MSQQWMMIVAGVGLTVWVLAPPIAILWPRRRRDPHDGVAVGCLTLVMIPGVLLAGMLAAGILWDVPLLIQIPFYVVALPLLLLAINALRLPYHLIRKRRRS